MNGNCKISEAFKRGLENHNVTLDEARKWLYCGGDKGRHQRYFNIFWKGIDRNLPDHQSNCVCGHSIQENCYITRSKDKDSPILVLGNCCIKRFIDKSGRTCEKCGKSHKNRKVNRCGTPTSGCRKGVCDTCDGKCDPLYAECYCCHTGEITFGKYKGYPVSVLLEDDSYINWLFKTKDGFATGEKKYLKDNRRDIAERA